MNILSLHFLQQNDVETTFKPYLDGVDMSELKSWYNGYNFLKSDMYNPFDILQFISKDFEYDNYWFESGTPTFLLKLIEKNNYFLPNLANIKVDKKLLSSFDIENLDLEVILYQSGYLTIDKVELTIFGTQEYTLKIPNKEVRQSFTDYIIHYLIEDDKPMQKKTNLYKSLLEKNMDNFKKSLISVFDTIPYNNFVNNSIAKSEGFYASIFFIYLQSLGMQIIGEDANNKGRIDLVIIMDKTIYICEFKVAGKGDALQQIKDNNYVFTL